MQLNQERAYDRFGNACLVLTTANPFHASSAVSIRLQDYIDADVASLVGESSSDRHRFYAKIRNKLTCVQNGLLAPASPPKNVALYPRRWTPTNSNFNAVADSSHSHKQTSFTVAQFNMLARGLASGPNHLFPTPFLPHHDFNGDYGGFSHLDHPQLVLDYHRVRKWRLLHVLLGGGLHGKEDQFASDLPALGDAPAAFKQRDTTDFHPPFDILALQEVDDYYSFWHPLLVRTPDESSLPSQATTQQTTRCFHNYHGLFQPKPNSPCVKFGWYSDGVALLWNSQKFNTISQPQHQQHLNSDQIPCSSATTADTLTTWLDMGSFVGSASCHNIPLHDPARIAATNQVYIIVPLQVIGTKKILIAATAHLKAKTGVLNERIRHLQALELRRRAHDMAIALQGCGWEDINIVILGDFNAEPTDPSVQNILQQDDDFGWDMESAYPPDSGHYTTWKARKNVTVCRIIDYIFYSTQLKKQKCKAQEGKVQEVPRSLQCTEILSVPERETVDELLPGFKYPSDHFLLAAKFVWG